MADGWKGEEKGKGKSKDEQQSRAGRAMPRPSHAIPHAHYGKNQICNEQEALRDGAISEMSEQRTVAANWETKLHQTESVAFRHEHNEPNAMGVHHRIRKRRRTPGRDDGEGNTAGHPAGMHVRNAR